MHVVCSGQNSTSCCNQQMPPNALAPAVSSDMMKETNTSSSSTTWKRAASSYSHGEVRRFVPRSQNPLILPSSKTARDSVCKIERHRTRIRTTDGRLKMHTGSLLRPCASCVITEPEGALFLGLLFGRTGFLREVRLVWAFFSGAKKKHECEHTENHVEHPTDRPKMHVV